MANYYSVGHTLFTANRFVPMKSWGSKVKGFLDTFEAAGQAAASIIYMFRPPKGAIWNGNGYLMSDLLGAGATLQVGIVGATTKFMAAIDHGTAALRTDIAKIAAIDAVGYEFDGATDVIITTAVAAITGTIKLYMEMLLPE